MNSHFKSAHGVTTKYTNDVRQHWRYLLTVVLSLLIVTTVRAASSSLSLANTGVYVDSSGTPYAIFEVNRSGDLSYDVNVQYLTQDGTAKAGTDYSPMSGTTTLPATQSVVELPLVKILNTTAQTSLTFTMNISNAVSDAPPAVTFDSPLASALLNPPWTVVTGDFNGDGKPDIAVGNGNKVSVFLNTTATGATTPSFSARQDFTVSVGNYLAVADINGDGKPDIVASGTGVIQVLINTTAKGAATVSFAAPQSVPVTAGGFGFYTPMAVADLNGDGKPDIIISDPYSTGTAVFLNTTTTGSSTVSFASEQLFSSYLGRSIAVADFNGDGKPDLALGGFGPSITILINTTPVGGSTVSFTTPAAYSNGETRPFYVATGDINGDGKPDVIMTFYNGSYTIPSKSSANCDSIMVMLNTTAAGGPVTFSTPEPFDAFGTAQCNNPSSSGQDSTPLTIADVNRDGVADIIVSDYNSNAIAVVANTTPPGSATASFAVPQLFSFNYHADAPWGIAAADFNGDGIPDVVWVDQYSGYQNVSVALNATPQNNAVSITTAQATGTVPLASNISAPSGGSSGGSGGSGASSGGGGEFSVTILAALGLLGLLRRQHRDKA